MALAEASVSYNTRLDCNFTALLICPEPKAPAYLNLFIHPISKAY